MTTHTPLQLPDAQWFHRWLLLPSGNVLHRVASIAWDDEGIFVGGEGTTLCGRSGWLRVPGVFGRLDSPRCSVCCRRAYVPVGDGAPWNTTEEWRNR